MSETDFNEIAESRKWTINEQDVQLPQNDSNTPKSSVTHERIEIERKRSPQLFECLNVRLTSFLLRALPFARKDSSLIRRALVSVTIGAIDSVHKNGNLT